MTPERWGQVTRVFHHARARDPAIRGVFLDEACAGDPELRAEVDAMLAADRDAGPFGDAPFVVLADEPDSDASPVETLQSDDAPGGRPASESDTPKGRRQPFVWIAWVVSLATAATFALAFSDLILNRQTAPLFGWDEARSRGEWFVTQVDPKGPSAGLLKEGDRLVRFDGSLPLGPTGTRFHRRRLSAGDTYGLAIERKGERLEVALRVSKGPSVLASRLTYFLISLVWCVVGLFIGLARPDRAVARLASGAAVMTGLNFLNTVIQSGPFFHPMHIVVGYHFFCLFPTGRRMTGISRWLLVFMYGAAVVPFLIGIWLHAALLAQGVSGAAQVVARHASVFELRRPAAQAVFYTSLVLIATMVWRNYRRLAEEDQRRRVRWIVYGSIIALAPQIVWAAEDVMGVEVARWFALAADAFTVGIPLAVAYAVVKHRVFDIKVVVRRGIQYVLAERALQLAVAVPLVVLALTLVANRDRTIGELTTESASYLYWVAIAALGLRFRRPIHRWLDRRFFHEEYDREQMLFGVVDDLGRAESISHLSELVTAKLHVALHPATSYIWYRDAGELAAVSSSNPRLTPPDFPANGRWLSWLEGHGAIADLPLPADAGVSRHESHWLIDRGVSLLVPIAESSDRLAGVLLIGRKKSEEPYTASDRRLLQTIAKQAAVVRENLRLRAQISEERRIRHDVLGRLDQEHVSLLKECPLCGGCFDGPVERCDRDGQALTLSLPVSRLIDGRYRLDSLIGKGGMGAVYEATDLRLQRNVAVKILLGHAFGDQKALRRFRAEARAAARLNHPRIVSVYEYGGLEGEGAYIVMERVRGMTLRDEMRRIGAIKPTQVADWFDQILDGVAAAHAHGVVHRDLKPENIIGCRDDQDRLAVKILDFGLAKVSGADATGTVTAAGVVMGTVGYMSPEQLLGSPADHHADIFAVGVMVAEALTGRTPFHGETRLYLSRAVLHDSYHLPCSSPAAYAVDELLQRCLAKDPRDRFASAAALRQALIPMLLTCPPFSFGALA